MTTLNAQSVIDRRWWPEQVPPKGVVRTSAAAFEAVTSPDGQHTEGMLGVTHMLVQSLAGLAALAVNEDRSDEMIWIETDSPDYAQWFEGLTQRLDLEDRGQFTAWELVARLQEQSIIQGYILYAYDFSEGDLYRTRLEMNHSVNVATTAAGLLGGILIEEGQEAQTQALGLSLLLDARGKDTAWCFDTYRDQLSRKLLCTQDTKVPHNRAMAIAHRAMTVYGTADPVPDIMAWLDPLSPMVGWNSGEEFSFTVLPTLYGHFNTATNWCLNLPILSADTQNYQPTSFASLDPATIEFDNTRHAVSFVMSDGDNVQWLMGNFCLSDDYWDNVEHGDFPLGWTNCVPNLMQVSPETVDYLANTKPPNVSMLQDAGGYYYPDRFGENRPEPDLLAQHARQVGAYMNDAGIKILWFICHNLQSAAAFAAYDTFAREIDGLLGMMAIQYTPYEGGAGKVFWTQDRNGVQIPIVTARYSLWANSVTGKRSGNPAHIADEINKRVDRNRRADKSTHEWAIVHAWSYFNRDDARERGLTPVGWCIEDLDLSIKVVSPEELLWRIRMEHEPEQTQNLIAKWGG